MSDNAQKSWMGDMLNEHTTQKALSIIHNVGKSLPVSIKKVGPNGTILTLKFETGASFTLPDVTVPITGTRYIRIPWKIGDKGYVEPGSVGIGNVSGLGPSTPPSFTNPANLSALVFHPTGNTSFAPPDNPNAVQHNAPEGVISRDDDSKSTMIVHPDNGATTTAESGKQASTWKPGTGITHSADGGNHVMAALAGVGVNIISTIKHAITAPAMTASGSLSVAGALSAASGAFGSMSSSGTISGSSASISGPITGETIATDGYTVALLNSTYPPAANEGMRAYVTDASGPTFLTLLSGGGSIVCPAFCNGAIWVAG